MDKETYLGDGLYASFDGYQFKLRAPRSDGDHEVYLEPPVYAEFARFAQQTLHKHSTPMADEQQSAG